MMVQQLTRVLIIFNKVHRISIMAEQYQFGNRVSGRGSQNLQHYRLEIRRLQQQNVLQAQAYAKKIQALESQLKNPSNQQQLSSNPFQSYQSAGSTNLEILKRDKQINKLSEENQRLRKQAHMNPDHELIVKNKKSYFDQLADKDAEIMKLKKSIYELEAKYDGKYFNDARMRNQFTLLQNENEKLRRQLQTFTNTVRPTQTQLNPQILQCIRFKKQAELLAKQNQHLKQQYKKLDDEYNGYRGGVSSKVYVGTENEALRSQLREMTHKNQELMHENDRLRKEMDKLGAGYMERDTMQRSRGSQVYNEQHHQQVGDSGRKRNKIFNRPSQEQYIMQHQPQPTHLQVDRQYHEQVMRSGSKPMSEESRDSGIPLKEEQVRLLEKLSQQSNQPPPQQQQQPLQTQQSYPQRPQSIQQPQIQPQPQQILMQPQPQPPQQLLPQKQPQSPQLDNRYQTLPPTQKKVGGFYGKYGLSRLTSRGSQEQVIM